MLYVFSWGFLANIHILARPKSKNHGFTLIEIIIVIAILSILAGTIAPMVIQETIRAKEARTLEEEKHIYDAIMGRPELGTYGYLGDMGILPDSVGMLGRQCDAVCPGSPTYTYTAGPPDTWTQPAPSAMNGTTIGWRGPYLSLNYDGGNRAVDPWGTPYLLFDTSGNFQIISYGPNRIPDPPPPPAPPDDIVYPTTAITPAYLGGAATITGDLSLTVHEDSNSTYVNDTTITYYTLYFSNQGVAASLSNPINLLAGPPVTPNTLPWPHGLHPVQINGTSGASMIVIVPVQANTSTTRDLWLNY